MNLDELCKNKNIKAKAKMAQIGDWLLKDELSLDELLAYAESQKGSNKATCIEALEYATKKNPNIADETLLNFVTITLKEEEPRIKWESAKVIGNIAKLFPTQLDKATSSLLRNAEHNGTVVRWATAFALAEIVKLKTAQNKKLLPKMEALCEKEEDGGVKKKYLDALKRAKK
jgi:hypothetical protein